MYIKNRHPRPRLQPLFSTFLAASIPVEKPYLPVSMMQKQLRIFSVSLGYCSKRLLLAFVLLRTQQSFELVLRADAVTSLIFPTVDSPETFKQLNYPD